MQQPNVNTKKLSREMRNLSSNLNNTRQPWDIANKLFGVKVLEPQSLLTKSELRQRERYALKQKKVAAKKATAAVDSDFESSSYSSEQHANCTCGYCDECDPVIAHDQGKRARIVPAARKTVPATRKLVTTGRKTMPAASRRVVDSSTSSSDDDDNDNNDNNEASESSSSSSFSFVLTLDTPSPKNNTNAEDTTSGPPSTPTAMQSARPAAANGVNANKLKRKLEVISQSVVPPALGPNITKVQEVATVDGMTFDPTLYLLFAGKDEQKKELVYAIVRATNPLGPQTNLVSLSPICQNELEMTMFYAFLNINIPASCIAITPEVQHVKRTVATINSAAAVSLKNICDRLKVSFMTYVAPHFSLDVGTERNEWTARTLGWAGKIRLINPTTIQFDNVYSYGGFINFGPLNGEFPCAIVQQGEFIRIMQDASTCPYEIVLELINEHDVMMRVHESAVLFRGAMVDALYITLNSNPN